MDIVDKVAADIAEIPGNPSAREIARIAIEAYQRELWTPAFFDNKYGRCTPELRRVRAQQLTAHIMHVVAKHLCDHGDRHGARDASGELFETIYESGAEVITDVDRSAAGLPPRGPYGLTTDELRILEAKRIETMLRPMPSVYLFPDTAAQS